MEEKFNSNKTHPFDRLQPDFVLDAIESLGYIIDGRMFALNSYENRVYQIGIDQTDTKNIRSVIAKFYRPERWSREQILEEHEFSFELAEQEIPVVTPIKLNGESLFDYQGFQFALFEQKAGHAPELDNPDHLLMLGRLIGRMHAVGAKRPFQHRPGINLQTYAVDSIHFVRDEFIPAEYKEAYGTLTDDILKLLKNLEPVFQQQNQIRLHADFHPGNILWRDDYFNIVDLDDCRTGPAIQDLWMMLSGSRAEKIAQLSELLEGYEEFFEFNPAEIQLIEYLRTLRILFFAAWIARRWHDPAFPMYFPWFNTANYWSGHILELREQFASLQEEPLALF